MRRLGQSRRHRPRWLLLTLLPLVAVGVVVVVMFGFALALGGGIDPGCGSSPGTAEQRGPAGPGPTAFARREIPPARLAIYRAAGRAQNIDWAFVASIGAQECDHGSCAGDNGSGCAGPMQIAVRRGSPCSPGGGPTLWDRYATDGDHDGKTDFNAPADSVFTAARVLREEKHAPATGGSYADYRQAACDYYGACGDAVADYAEMVMRRATQYGFDGAGSPSPTTPPDTAPAPPSTPPGGSQCGGTAGPPEGGGKLGPVRKATGPRELAPLPASAVAPGFGELECDARIVPDVTFLVRKYGVRVTACFSIHSLAGEHPLGAAVDLVPRDGDWDRTLKLARAVGWKRSCATSGVAPGCAKAPFRFVGYSGYPGHGDPETCVPCSGGPHLHLSWQTSASQGQPENRPRTGHFAPSWITVSRPSENGASDATD